MVGPEKKTILAGKYRLVRQLGRGGMGSVWYAEHLTLQAPVAIKLIDPEIAKNAETLHRFLQEAKAAAALRSPHVVQVFDHGVDDGVPFIVMEMLEGESLADRLEARGKLPPAETARILTQVARALTRAHEAGIIHRDLKPENIFLVRNDEEPVAKILDFGIAKSTSSGLVLSQAMGTQSGIVMGTPVYMSPEQAEGRALDQRTDVWALGVIAFECIVGRRPFEGDTIGSVFLAVCARPLPVPSKIGPVPLGFDDWFARVCARDVEARISSAKAAAADLRRICGVETSPPSVSSADPVSIAPRWDGSDPPLSRAPNDRVSAEPIAPPATGEGTFDVYVRRRAKRRRVSFFIAISMAAAGVAIFGWTRLRAPTSGATEVLTSPAGVISTLPATSAEVPPSLEPVTAASSATITTVHPATSVSTAPLRKGSAKPVRSAPARSSASPASTGRPKVNFGF